ncbi:MAG: Deoxyguanosinetriphosphate triphosphohydrolase-like protein [Promethearchaeota archaeon]|nr:MAG: Deoxyguanosinetriphosphate triphosphohydrolase-like protein [Candidatus Lokiarchaeota archaeon]
MSLNETRINLFRKRLSKTDVGEWGTSNSEATRYFPEEDTKDYEDIRPPFFRDTDRIVHSKAYARYIDKSQVFYGINNANLTHRALHVLLVSRVARQIGRIFHLNTDLIEAIALGHDIGHSFASHLGEDILDEFSREHGLGRFRHNAQGVRWLTYLEKRFPEQPAKGLNLTLQVVDGILCHNGEMEKRTLEPFNRNKTWKDHFKEYEQSFTKEHIDLIPMTYEAIVVRFADVISYIGRDIEDAILLKYIKRDQLPKGPQKILGNTNRKIMNTLIMDLLNYSLDNHIIGYSEEVFNALKELKRFNYEQIYYKRDLNLRDIVTEQFNLIFERSLHAVQVQDFSSPVFKDHIEYIDDHNYTSYYEPLKKEGKLTLIVRDYICGMSDKYFNDTYLFLKKITN